MFRFNIDITPSIDGKEVHLEGICEMLSSDTFKVTMTEPYKGLSVTKHFDDAGEMDMDATFSKVEKDLIKLYEQETKRIGLK
ncbi:MULTISPECIES: hypothetical protein [Segatella]|uniref:Phage protein n=1 Tax=Segatella sinensis TaxID=3085167 RepID=A0ABV1FV33_9BACT